MRNTVIAVSILFSSSVFAIEYNKKHHVILGADFFHRDYSEDLVFPKKSDERGMLGGVLIGYEHKAPESLLLTIDLETATNPLVKVIGCQYHSFHRYQSPPVVHLL